MPPVVETTRSPITSSPTPGPTAAATPATPLPGITGNRASTCPERARIGPASPRTSRSRTKSRSQLGLGRIRDPQPRARRARQVARIAPSRSLARGTLRSEHASDRAGRQAQAQSAISPKTPSIGPTCVNRSVKPLCRRTLEGHRLVRPQATARHRPRPRALQRPIDDLDGSNLGSCWRRESVTRPGFTTRACSAAPCTARSGDLRGASSTVCVPDRRALGGVSGVRCTTRLAGSQT